eukprot:3140378-Alexandrium_andersonii.AAC.1
MLISAHCAARGSFAQSSMEAEFYGIGRGSIDGIFAQGVLGFLGWDFPLIVATDSAAGKAATARSG